MTWNEHHETRLALDAWHRGEIIQADITRIDEGDLRTAYRRAKERRAAAELQADIMEGKVPDWPAWSELMRGVPL